MQFEQTLVAKTPRDHSEDSWSQRVNVVSLALETEGNKPIIQHTMTTVAQIS